MIRALRAVAVGALMAIAVLRVLRLPAPVSRYVVEGPSMLPAYRPGERLLVNRLSYARRSPAVGDVVVLRDPERPARYLLKRIAAARGDGDSLEFDVRGDNAGESRDSRQFGLVRREAIVGRAWWRY
jgi:signal peptidase I